MAGDVGQVRCECSGGFSSHTFGGRSNSEGRKGAQQDRGVHGGWSTRLERRGARRRRCIFARELTFVPDRAWEACKATLELCGSVSDFICQTSTLLAWASSSLGDSRGRFRHMPPRDKGIGRAPDHAYAIASCLSPTFCSRSRSAAPLQSPRRGSAVSLLLAGRIIRRCSSLRA